MPAEIYWFEGYRVAAPSVACVRGFRLPARKIAFLGVIFLLNENYEYKDYF